MSQSGVETWEVLEALEGRGFRYVAHFGETGFQLAGSLQTDDGAHECTMLVSKDFSAPPAIILRTIPERLRPIAPHISNLGSLCYLSSSLIAINVFDPIGQMLACVDRASFVLNEILAGRAVDDLVDEFFVYWGMADLICQYDVADLDARDIQTYLRNDVAPHQLIVTDSLARTRNKVALADDTRLTGPFPAVLVRTQVSPRPSTENWPIKTVGDLLDWQAGMESRAARRIEDRIARCVEQGMRAVTVVLLAPKIHYAFSVSFNDPEGKRIPTEQLRKKSVMRAIAVYPVHVNRIDNHYVTQRNIPGMQTLAGKKITVVGCGTIGGYLAELLMKAGAGSGSGQLTLVDDDSLAPGNLGRHRLGFGYLDKNKAEALRDELEKTLPGVNVKALPNDIRDVVLRGQDLIIDATGEEAMGSLLTRKYVDKCALISVWTVGPGVAVRAVLKSKSEHACPYCLTLHGKEGRYLPTVQPIEQIYAGQGCEQEYVPFAASASIQAACLASELVLDWMRDHVGNNVRTRVLDEKYDGNATRMAVERFDGCPACRT